MAKLYYYYGAMGSSKSATLLMAAHTYERQGKKVMLFTSYVDDRFGTGVIASRVGIDKGAEIIGHNDNVVELVGDTTGISCIFIDECQFLTREQVMQLSDIVDNDNVPVICYGLKTDFKGELFEGSAALFELADSFNEIKTTCSMCESKATMNLRTNNGKPVKTGNVIQIGDDEYFPMCRKHYKKSFL